MQKFGTPSEKSPISYAEASDYIKDILSFALASNTSTEGLEIASEVFLSNLFGK